MGPALSSQMYLHRLWKDSSVCFSTGCQMIGNTSLYPHLVTNFASSCKRPLSGFLAQHKAQPLIPAGPPSGLSLLSPAVSSPSCSPGCVWPFPVALQKRDLIAQTDEEPTNTTRISTIYDLKGSPRFSFLSYSFPTALKLNMPSNVLFSWSGNTSVF